MKKILALVVVVLLLTAGAAFAGDTPDSKKPRKLADRQLDTVTAGNTETDGGGGAIVANGSTAKLKKGGSLSLDGGAQQDTRSLNLVNAADSGVANAVNVWDGRLDTQTVATTLNVDQNNLVNQNQSRSGSLPLYNRTQPNVDSTEKVKSSLNLDTSSKITVDHRDIQTTETTRDLTTNGEVNAISTILGQSVQAGKGIAGSGDIQVDFDGGSISIMGTMSAGGSSGFDGTVTFDWVLPKLSVDFNGSICAVMNGSCKVNGTLNETSKTSNDKSLVDETLITEKRIESLERDATEKYRGALKIENALAEFIVVDDSTLELDQQYSVSLSGTSQQNARALNLVNAAGSVIANAVNVARTPTVGPVLNLNQINVVNQRR